MPPVLQKRNRQWKLTVGVFENHNSDDSHGIHIYTTGTPTYSGGNNDAKHENPTDYDALHRELQAFDSPEPDSHLIQRIFLQNIKF